ncbi:hypothetical protein B0H10DRAFT_378751 [Mycena sp. CBHHK59/15]|nr:hypothetical protein B0H10DRAFT_378751 [Mycena sp. CBHHK59/15]
MHNSQDQAFQWTQYNNSHGRPDIKVESLPDNSSLLSPPSSPSLPLTVPSSSLSSSRRRSTSRTTSSPKRARPYPPLPREIRSRIDESEMATTPAFWVSSSNARGSSSRANNNDRRPSDGGTQQMMYTSPYASMPMYSERPSQGDHRSPSSGSSGTSSLTGAMGEAHVSSNSRHSESGSPPPRGDPLFTSMGQSMGQSLNWNSQSQPPMIASNASSYPGVAGGMPYLDPQTSQYGGYRNVSPESLSPPSPFSTNFNDFRPGSTNYPTTNDPAYSSPPVNQQDAEIRRLRKKIRELEQVNERTREQFKTLESGLARRAYPVGGLPSPISTPPSTASFQASWKARTDARIRQFCSLNRAGNALCAWHDSRRERRVYPPRMAPDGYLNCGCTYEEALFEESLSRHHVGSYLPGETVRMDPALRNPLLKLLQARYGYKDGDFERDPRTGDWLPGDGPGLWQQQIGATIPRRDRR